MTKMIKKQGQDFVILNLTDIHMDDNQLEEGCAFLQILHTTLDTLVERVRPDFITVTGDLAWGGHHKGQRYFIDRLDSYGIPWAPVLGNHDHEIGDDALRVYENMFAESPYCLYEPGDPSLGNGNYVIAVEEEGTGRLVEGLIFMDTHNQGNFTNEQGETLSGYDKLWDNQLSWYENQVEKIRELGCEETVIFQHMPVYAYKEAFDAAFRKDLDSKAMPCPEGGKDCWNLGYENSTGVNYDWIGCPPVPDHVLERIVQSGSTKYIFCGHEHTNNWQIFYKGMNLVYTLKTGCGCYWHYPLNGGTVIRIGNQGVSQVAHEYVELPEGLRGEL